METTTKSRVEQTQYFRSSAIMKSLVTVTNRGVVTLPVEIYSERRVREFDEAEADLVRAMRSDSAKATRATKRRR